MELPEAMCLAFKWLEDNYEVKWTKGLGSRENLLDAFSQTEFPKAEYLGYLGSDGIRHSFHRAIKNCDKPKGVLWENWLLYNTGKFYCPNCKRVLDLENKRTSLDNRCKECDNTKTLTRRESNQRYIADYLSNSVGCVDCGEKDIRCLDFDHSDPSIKDFNIGECYMKSKEVIKAELEKCQIVCANCHRKRTSKSYGYYKQKYIDNGQR